MFTATRRASSLVSSFVDGPRPMSWAADRKRRPNACVVEVRQASRLFLVRVGTNVVPKIAGLFVAEHPSPRRHLIFAIVDGVFESQALVRPQASDIESLAGIDEIVAVASRTIHSIDFLARRDLGLVLRFRTLLRRRIRCDDKVERKGDARALAQ